MKYLPNILTVTRIFLTVGFILCFFQPQVGSIALASALFILASITDFYDGYFAKKYKCASNFGKIMDPIADKFLTLTAFLVFVLMGVFPLWIFYVIFVRELFVTGTRLFAIRKGKYIAAEKAGKLKTVLQIILVLLILGFLMAQAGDLPFSWMAQGMPFWQSLIYIVLTLTLAVTVISGVSYLWNNRKILLTKFS